MSQEKTPYSISTNNNRKTSTGLVNHATSFLCKPTIYVWGGLGELLTNKLLHKLRIKYPDFYTKEKLTFYIDYINKTHYGFDCSGLIKNYLMGGEQIFEYDSSLDYNSGMLFEQATIKGTIHTLPEIPGICLYMQGHTGIYIGAEKVIEATNNAEFGNGVVLTKLKDRIWEKWFKCPHILYTEK